MEQKTLITSTNFNVFLAQKRLMASKCRKCGALFLPPRAICPTCWESELEWVELSGKGKLAAFTCISITPTWMAAAGYGRNNPYCSGIIQTTEGPKIACRIEGVDARDPESIKIGTLVEVDIRERTQGDKKIPYLAFKVA
ncbi:MAG: Zn-ribbon domain-containing OB-fold protein [Dehalococcoidia bacterium]|nr:Zn-ribbon domain-containing OB-fold protein [Dehalococcoidia bacterium]